PHFSAVFEEKLFVDQPAVRDACHHLPVANDHAHVQIRLAAWGTQLHRFFDGLRMKVGCVPVPRVPQLRLPPCVVQLQQQIDLLDCCSAHRSSLEFTALGFFTAFFLDRHFAASVDRPPADIALATITAALAMHAGHIDAPHYASATGAAALLAC